MTQSIVQISTARNWNNSATPTTAPSLTGVTALNDLVLLVVVITYVAGTTAADLTASDAQGSYSQDCAEPYYSIGGNLALAAIFRLKQANSGTHTVTVTTTNGSASYGWAQLVEVSGDANAAVDTTAVNSGSSTTPSCGPTSALAQANEIAFSAIGGYSTFTAWNEPSGWTNISNTSSGSFAPYSFDYIVTTTNTALTANYGTISASQNWGGCIATYEAYIAPSANFRRTLSPLGTRVGSRQTQL